MLVSFWSPVRGLGHITTTMLSSAIILGLDHNRISLLLSGIQGNDESILQSLQTTLPESGVLDAIRSVGMQVDARRLRPDILKDHTTSLVVDRVDLLDTSSMANGDEAKRHVILSVVDSALKTYNGYFMDIGSGPLRPLERSVGEKSALVVVCLPQNPNVIRKMMPLVKEQFKGSKVLYCLTAYDVDVLYTASKFASEFKISSKHIATVPYSSGLINAVHNGKVLTYLTRLYGLKKSLWKYDPDIHFLESLQDLNKKMLVMGGLLREEIVSND